MLFANRQRPGSPHWFPHSCVNPGLRHDMGIDTGDSGRAWIDCDKLGSSAHTGHNLVQAKAVEVPRQNRNVAVVHRDVAGALKG